MRLFLALLALGFAAVAAVPANPQRITGGTTTTINQYPSIVAMLFTRDGYTFIQACGGTILNSRNVLTAAQCINGNAANRWRIRVGSTNANSGGVVHILISFQIHPNYNRWNFDNDIAIVRTSSNIIFNVFAQAASIAGSNYNLRDNQVVWAAGWGALRSNGPHSEQLRHVQIWTVNQGTCRSRYAGIGFTVTDNMLCAGWLNVGGRDQCDGDAGGPLYHNGVLVGVCSWGEGCGLPLFPGVNTRVSRYTSWIQSNSLA